MEEVCVRACATSWYRSEREDGARVACPGIKPHELLSYTEQIAIFPKILHHLVLNVRDRVRRHQSSVAQGAFFGVMSLPYLYL